MTWRYEKPVKDTIPVKNKNKLKFFQLWLFSSGENVRNIYAVGDKYFCIFKFFPEEIFPSKGISVK